MTLYVCPNSRYMWTQLCFNLAVGPLSRDVCLGAHVVSHISMVISGQIVGERGGTAIAFRFLRGNAVTLAYTAAVGTRKTAFKSFDDSYLQQKQQKNVR